MTLAARLWVPRSACRQAARAEARHSRLGDRASDSDLFRVTVAGTRDQARSRRGPIRHAGTDR